MCCQLDFCDTEIKFEYSENLNDLVCGMINEFETKAAELQNLECWAFDTKGKAFYQSEENFNNVKN